MGYSLRGIALDGHYSAYSHPLVRKEMFMSHKRLRFCDGIQNQRAHFLCSALAAMQLKSRSIRATLVGVRQRLDARLGAFAIWLERVGSEHSPR